jgi:hypothetical protein
MMTSAESLRDPAAALIAFDNHAPMTEPRQSAPVPTLALRVEHAAASLGLSESTFRRDVLPNVRSVKVGRVHVVAVIELERWFYLHGRLGDEE